MLRRLFGGPETKPQGPRQQEEPSPPGESGAQRQDRESAQRFDDERRREADQQRRREKTRRQEFEQTTTLEIDHELQRRREAAEQARREREAAQQARREREEAARSRAERVRQRRARTETRRHHDAEAEEAAADHTLLHADQAARDEIEERVRNIDVRLPAAAKAGPRAVLPAALAKRLTPAQQLFVGSEVFRRRSPWRPVSRRRS
jgi:colicin import membrane protein